MNAKKTARTHSRDYAECLDLGVRASRQDSYLTQSWLKFAILTPRETCLELEWIFYCLDLPFPWQPVTRFGVDLCEAASQPHSPALPHAANPPHSLH